MNPDTAKRAAQAPIARTARTLTDHRLSGTVVSRRHEARLDIRIGCQSRLRAVSGGASPCGQRQWDRGDGAGDVQQGGDADSTAHSRLRQQQPGGAERAGSRAERVDAVQPPDDRGGSTDIICQAPGQQGERRTHQTGGPEQPDQQEQGGRAEAQIDTPRPLVEDVVEQRIAEETEPGHRQFRRREERDAAPPRHPIRNLAAAQAAAAEARHERGDDDRRRVNVGARKDHQHALPGDLIDHRGGPGSEEDDQRGNHRRAPSRAAARRR